MKFSLLSRNLLKLSYLSAVFFSISSCSKKNDIVEKESINTEYANDKYLYNIYTDPFDPKFIHDLEKIIDKEQPVQIKKIKRMLNKLKKTEELTDDESKYSAILELTKALPEKFLIDERHQYNNKYQFLIEQLNSYYNKTAKAIPKEIHFIWLGGPLGEIQKDYVKIWAKLNPDHNINIWYDSDNLYTYETNKGIKEFLNYTLAEEKNSVEYQKLFAEKFINIQNDLFDKLIKNKNSDTLLSLDQERLHYIEKVLYNKNEFNYDEINKKTNLMQNDIITLKNEFSNIYIKDFKVNKSYWPLNKNYEQEMLLRGNFAAASDSARIEIISRFGGIYMDIDILPSIKELNNFIEKNNTGPYKEFLSRKTNDLTIYFYEQIFNHHKHFIPSRKMNNKFKNSFVHAINKTNLLEPLEKSELKTEINRILLKLKEQNLEQIFNKINTLNIRQGEFKASYKSNSLIASHQLKSENDWLQLLKNKIQESYKKINKIEKNNPNFYYDFNNKYILSNDYDNYIEPKIQSKLKYDIIIHDYRYDSLFSSSRSTIHTSGPGLLKQFYEDLFPSFISTDGWFNKNTIVQNCTEFPLINNIFNYATEEDANSSWAKKTISFDGEKFNQRDVILAVGQNENIKNASNFIYTKKQTENTNSSLIDTNDLIIKNNNNNDYEKVNLYIVGHAEISEDTVKIGNLTANELAEKISDFIEKNKNEVIDYIDIVSCNPTKNPNDTDNIEKFTKLLFNSLDDLGISLDIITIRKNIIKIDYKGNELIRTKYGMYNYSNDADKLYIVRKGRNDFLSISTGNIIDQINPENIKNLNRFNSTLKNILSKKTEALGDFSNTINKLRDAYLALKTSRNNSTVSQDNSSSQNISNSKSNITYVTKEIAKYTFNGLDKFTSMTNKYNVIMSLINTPQSLSYITTSFKNEMYLDGSREAANFTINNADLVLDIVKSYKGTSYWQQHANAFQNINKIQIGLNFVSAGADIWQAYDLFKESSRTEDQSKKMDFIVNASFVSARAASSIATAIFLPLTAKAGPIGAAIGFTIMFSQGTFNAVRTSQELRKLGFKEEDITLKSILKFFGQYQENEDSSYVTKIESNKLNNEIIPNILNEKNKEYINALANGKGEENKLFYFKKIVYPKVDLYIPYSIETTTIGCSYGTCVPSRSGGKPLENASHSCLTNNSYYASDSNRINEIESYHMNAIQLNHSLLALKKTDSPQAPKGENYSQASIQHNNKTIPCPNISISTPMIVKTHLPKTEDIEKIKQIPEHKKANLYLAGFGDQGTHGNMIHSIIGDLNDINFYNIHPATYMLHILGGNKEDIFDFYDIVHSKNKNKGFIDGGNGIDTINLQGIKDKKITVSLSNLKPSDFPEIKNVENLFGTNEDDTIYGNEEDNFLVGNAGNDSIFGENGNDTIIPSIGFDKLNGGKGNDTYLILTKDLINNKIEEIKNNSEIIQNELNKIKEPLNLLNLKYKIILKNTNDIYNKIQNYHSYMSEIKDIYINNIAATNELKELSKKIFAIGNNIYNISTQVKIKLKNYDTPSMNLEKNIDFIIDLNSNLNKLDESIKNNLIKVENFIKSINDFQIQNEDFDSKINKYQSNSFGFDSLSDFNRMMAMQTQSLKSEYIKSQKLNFLNSKNEILSNLNLLYKNLNNISIKSDSMSNEINNIKNKMSLVFDGHKIIDNFDESYLIEKNHGVDIIKTDIKNLISKKEEYNLTLGFNQNNKFIPAIILRDYFKGEKYQHIILTDLSGNIYTNINGSLYQEGLIENTLDVVKLDSENSLIYLDRLENLLVDTKKNIICSNKNETIYGNIFDNFIFGNGGFDKIYGNDGNDTISIEMNSYIKKLESNFEDTEIIENKNYSEINGGSGFDNYILNFNDNYILEDDYNIIIDNYDLNNNMDNLIINDLNSEVKYISFHKSNDVQFGKEMLQINFEDKNNKNYSLFIKNWFKSENYRHLQIQIGKDITITNNLMEQITKSIEDGKNIFSLKIYSKTQSLKKIDSDDGSINYINSENSINEIEEINFKTENNFIKNKIIKISNFEEETIFKLIEKDKLNIFSFVIFKNNQNNSIKKEFKIKINDEIILNKEQLTEYMNTIKLGEIIDISIN